MGLDAGVPADSVARDLDSPLEADLLVESLPIVDGRMTVPAGPGLGVELDEDAVARYRVS